MEEEKNEEIRNEKVQTKSSKGVIIFLLLIIIALGACTGYLFYKMKEIENKADTEQIPSEPVPTKTEEVKNLNSTLKYDLKNDEVSNFDLAFLKLENKKENKIYSPLSIKYALKMLEEGANGQTKKEISNVLNGYKMTKYISNKNMSLANALFVKDTFKDSVKEDYKTNLKEKYNAEVILDSFATAKNVNEWVSEKTLKLIPNLLDSVDSNTDFLLINALGIDMEWKNKFFDSYKKGFDSWVEYKHEADKSGFGFGWTCNVQSVIEKEFGENKLRVSGMEIGASIDNYDIVKELGEENIRKTVGDAYREWIKQNGTNAYGDKLSNDTEIEKEISRYLDEYIKELKGNYNTFGESKSIDFSVYVDDDVKVFAKDLKEYNGTTLQYVGIMPINEDLDKFIEKTNSTKMNSIINNLKELKRENFKDKVVTKIEGFIPKFDFEYSLKLKDDLEKIGIKDVFNSEKADITGICDNEGEYIYDVLHKANIEFTQDGIKAAAATMAGGAGAGGPFFDYYYEIPVEEIDLTFDKPYMFIIRDKETGDVWFTGTVYEPLEYEKDTTTEHYW